MEKNNMFPSPVLKDSYFTNLPRKYYVSEDIFQKELTHVFSRQWLLVGHASSIRNVGDYYVKQVGPESMIITRDNEGKIRAFFNVCRHRGSRILDNGESGCKKAFVCPYHKWSFNNQGELKSAPNSRDGEGFNFSEWGLHEAHCQIWHGWIYIYLAQDTPPQLADILGPISDIEALEAIGSDQLKLAHQETYVINANWKSLMENNCECYHCGHGGHPSLAIACDHDGFATDADNSQYFPLREGMETFSIDGKRVSSKPLGTPQPDGFSTGFLLVPNFCGPVFFVDHAVSLELTPLELGKSQLICEWYVHEEAKEGIDYDVEKLKTVFHVTNQEDCAFAETAYEGIKSMRYLPGPHNPRRESRVKVALDQYLQMLES